MGQRESLKRPCYPVMFSLSYCSGVIIPHCYAPRSYIESDMCRNDVRWIQVIVVRSCAHEERKLTRTTDDKC